MIKRIKVIISSLIFILLITLISFNIFFTYSLEEYQFESPIYNIEENYIKNISVQTEINDYYNYFDINNCTIKVFDINDKEIKKGYIYTGTKTNIYNKDNKLITTYTNIVKGDINNDGISDESDIKQLSNKLINNQKIEEYYKKAIDINNDEEIKANDIALLNDSQNKNYESLSLNITTKTIMTNEKIRLIPTINPNIIVDQNLQWTSSNQEVAIVNSAGLIEPKKEGETVITASTKNGEKTQNATIKVDNTVKLSKTDGKIYIGGKQSKIKIKAVDYDELICYSSSEEILTCKIEEEYLILNLTNKAKPYTTATITVKSPKYKEAIYKANIVDTYITVFPKDGCISVNTLVNGTISSFNAGELELNISDKEIIKESYVKSNRFFIRTGSKPGNATVTITELNGMANAIFNAKVYKLATENIGKVGKVNGEDIQETIISENLGNLTCVSSNEEVATCKIEDKTLYIHPLSKGIVTITIKDDICQAKKDFIAVIEGE